MKKVRLVYSDLAKAGMGEGSRGGHIIGHTKSGKPIYDSASHPQHAHFSQSDWDDAGKAFAKHGANQQAEQKQKTGKQSLSQIDDKQKTLPTRNEGYGFHGSISATYGEEHASKAYAHAQRAVAKLHNISLAQARNYLDSKAGRHLVDQLDGEKPTKANIHTATLSRGFYHTGPVKQEGYDPRHPDYHPDNFKLN